MDSTQYNKGVTFTNVIGLLILILHSSLFIDKSHFCVIADTEVVAHIVVCCTEHVCER